MTDGFLLVILGSLLAVAVGGRLLVRSELDPVSVLTLFLVFLIGINAHWVLPGAGAVGTPAMVIAAIAAWWWWMAKVSPGLGMDRGINPVRVALLAYLWFVALSWGLARMRPLSELEVNGSNMAMLTAIGLTGVALLTMDGIGSMDRLQSLLRRLVVGGAALSSVGLLQFAFGFDLQSLMTFPGLVRNSEAASSLATRSGLARADGTALNSLEFSVVLAMILPVALHFALRSPDQRSRRIYAVLTAVIAAGIPLSVSRSGLVAVAGALVLLSIAWSWRERLVGLGASAAGLIAMGVLVPGLLGTFRYLILGASEDISVDARLARIPRVEATFSEAPWLGSGVGTFSPDEDFLLDNQVFGTLLDMGLLGLVVVLSLFGIAILACLRVSRHTSDSVIRHFAFALMAGIAVLPVSMTTFDAFFYRILMGVAFVLVGSAGVLWRLVVRDDQHESVTQMAETSVSASEK